MYTLLSVYLPKVCYCRLSCHNLSCCYWFIYNFIYNWGCYLLKLFSFSGEPGSAVFGSILDGHFEGKIISPTSGNYYVEKASRYFPFKETNSSFHTIVYRESDVEDPYLNIREGMLMVF